MQHSELFYLFITACRLTQHDDTASHICVQGIGNPSAQCICTVHTFLRPAGDGKVCSCLLRSKTAGARHAVKKWDLARVGAFCGSDTLCAALWSEPRKGKGKVGGLGEKEIPLQGKSASRPNRAKGSTLCRRFCGFVVIFARQERRPGALWLAIKDMQQRLKIKMRMTNERNPLILFSRCWLGQFAFAFTRRRSKRSSSELLGLFCGLFFSSMHQGPKQESTSRICHVMRCLCTSTSTYTRTCSLPCCSFLFNTQVIILCTYAVHIHARRTLYALIARSARYYIVLFFRP